MVWVYVCNLYICNLFPFCLFCSAGFPNNKARVAILAELERERKRLLTTPGARYERSGTPVIAGLFALLNIVSFFLQHLTVQTDHEGVQGECRAAAHRCPTEGCSTGDGH